MEATGQIGFESGRRFPMLTRTKLLGVRTSSPRVHCCSDQSPVAECQRGLMHFGP